jgi:zinc protease
VQTSATADSLVELVKEITDLVGARAVSEDQIAGMEATLIPVLCGRFETTAGIADQIRDLITYNLGDDYYSKSLEEGSLPPKTEIDRVAKQYLKPEEMTILVVGDRSKIEGPLKSLPFVKSIRLLDVQGNPLQAPVASTPALAGPLGGSDKTSNEEQD